MTTTESKKIKNIFPKEEDDVQLPELPAWEKVVGRPTSLADLDDTANTLLESNAAEILTLGDIAYLDSIDTTEITDDAITTPKILSGAIIASKIASGAITTAKLDASAVTADKIDVDDLFAEDIDASGSITGALIRTSSGGDRVEIDDSDDSIKIYDSNDLRIEIYEDRITFYDDGEDEVASLYATPSGNFLLAGHTGADVLMSSFSDLLFSADDDIILTGGDTVTLTTTDISDDVFIGLGGNTFMQFGDARVYMDVYFDMEGNDITDGGDFTCVSLTETSDIRRKKNVKALSYGLNEVLKLDPIQYQFKKQTKEKKEGRRLRNPSPADEARMVEKTKEKHLGFSAQEVFKIMPELTKHADGKTEETARLYTTQLIPVLVNAVKELHSEVEDVKSKVLQ